MIFHVRDRVWFVCLYGEIQAHKNMLYLTCTMISGVDGVSRAKDKDWVSVDCCTKFNMHHAIAVIWYVVALILCTLVYFIAAILHIFRFYMHHVVAGPYFIRCMHHADAAMMT